MILAVKRQGVVYECDYTTPLGIRCGEQHELKLNQLRDLRETQAFPPCSACGSIRMVNLTDPREAGEGGLAHPGYSVEGNHTPAALDLIHTQAILGALAKEDLGSLYREHYLSPAARKPRSST